MPTIATTQFLKLARYVKKGKAAFPQRFKPSDNEKRNIGKKWEILIRSGEAHIDHSGHVLQPLKTTKKNDRVLWEELVKTGTAHKNYGWAE